jgi:uncharacterized protein YgiM (DUF1202 family)
VKAQSGDDRWIYTVSSEDGTKVYLESSYKERDGGIRVIWAKYVNKNGTYNLHLLECDCQQGKQRDTKFIVYNRFGTVLDSSSWPYASWETPVPESIGEALSDKVCEVKRQTVEPLPPPRQPTYQVPETQRAAPDLEDLGVDYAIITATRANLREYADVKSSALIEIPKGDLVVLLNQTPVGPWYNVIHVKSNQEGWIHNSTVITNFTSNRKPNFTIPGRNTGSYKDPTVEVKNDSDRTMTLKLGETRYTLSPNESRLITLTPGKISFHASAPGVIPNFGEQIFELGYIYTWRFYIVTTQRSFVP